jgi:predicted dinucleotide-utilizing enzyme
MAEKDNKTSTNKYAELRRTQFEMDTVVIDGKTFTVINAFPTNTDVTVEDRLRYLVKVS